MTDITRDEAALRAEEVVAELVRTERLGDVAIAYAQILETEDAWYVPYDSRAYIEYGDMSHALVGNLPVMVPKNGDAVVLTNFPD